MRKILANSLTKFVMLSGIGIIVLFYVDTYETLTSKFINKNINHSLQVIEGKIPINIRLTEANNFEYDFLKGSVPTFHLITDETTKSKKIKVLHTILNNEQKRKKFEYVVKKATELKLPVELALIPVIESEYNNKAVSPKGAGGVWQLMPKTAKIFGLSKKQRFEMEASTEAALLYFKDLYNEFGNWEFAIAAYNAGNGRVSKALHKNAHAKTIHDLKLPRETRNYVITFNQLKKVLKFYNVTDTIQSGTA